LSVLWIIEAAGAERSVARCLQGDFAVRVFASRESFRLLTRGLRGASPDLIVWHCEKAEERELGGAGVEVLALRPGDPRLADGFGLSAYVREKIARGKRGGAGSSVLRYKDVVLDFTRLTLVLGDKEETLPLKEGQLLKMLLERAGATCTREEISSRIWSGVCVTPRTIDSHVSRLRKKLKDATITIQGVYGDGYVLR
jgi:hypothetical protein